MPGHQVAYRQHGFVFEHVKDDVIAVLYRKEYIGRVRTSSTSSGRHCFIFADDESKNPQHFRGRLVAGQALLKIHRLLKKSIKEGWPKHKLVFEAWKDPAAQSRPQ